jgi:hypothetical protein
MNNTHHGQLIEKVVRRNGHSITDLARLTHVNRRSVYNWFNQPRLKARTIKSIGEAIQFDFGTLFPEIKEDMDYRIYLSPVNVSEDTVASDNHGWKDKYIELLERHSQLLAKIGEDKISK